MAKSVQTGKPAKSGSFPNLAAEILESIGQHRLLSNAQVRELHIPDMSENWTAKIIRGLRKADLIATVRTRTRPSIDLHYLTADGHKSVSTGAPLEKRIIQVTHEGAAGSLQQHTLSVNDVGIAFVKAARERGDECGYLSWRHEIAHVLSISKNRSQTERVIADAVLRYTMFDINGNARLLSRFVELDRATKPMEDLAQQLRRYARLYGFSTNGSGPTWKRDYPNGFPQILLVLGGSPGVDRATLQRRMNTILAITHNDPTINENNSGVVISCCLLEDLCNEGPFAQIMVRHTDPSSYIGWLD
jgi:hypothetical protein